MPTIQQSNMALDFQNPDLELQLQASLAQQEAQANETRALLAQLKHSSSSSNPQPGFSPSDASLHFPGHSEQQQQQHNPIMAHSMDNGFLNVQAHGHGSDLFPVMENGGMMGVGTMENPGDFLQRVQGVHGVPILRNERTIPLYGQDQSMHTAYPAFQQHDLSPSQCGSLTSGPTFSDMSRTNSNANQSVSGQMISFDSQSSFADGMSNSDLGYSPDQQPSPNKKRSAPSEDLVTSPSSASPSGPFASCAPVHMGRSTSIDSRLSASQSQHAPASLNRHLSLQSRSMQRSDSQLSRQSFGGTQQGGSMMRAVSGSSDKATQSQRELSKAIRDAAAKHGESMARTISASSAKSTQSQRLQRHNEALKSHIAHAEMQPLAPKPKADSTPTSSSQSEAKTGVDGKVAMPRTSGYQRPKRPKIACDQCDENPDGFRGEHELRRHKDLKHSKEFKRFVCRTPSQLGAESDLQPIYPLDKCKHCTSNKEYGQYYNAAAHLRRAHFTKKPPRATRSKNAQANGSDEPNEKRGGKGGGDWPPMSELKAKWMEEIKSTKPANDAAATSSDEDNAQDMEMYDGGAAAASYPSYLGGAPTGFDDAAASFVGSATNLQVQNADVYTDPFNTDLNYTTSSSGPMHEYDASMLSSTGSANFDFNAGGLSTAHHGGGYHHSHDLAMDMNMTTAAFQSPNHSTSTATLTPFHAFGSGHEGQFVPKATGGGVPMVMGQPDVLDDMDFGLAMGAEYDDGTFQRS
ncbi:hypothetical protein N0V82_007630 [Gnomoniopsis sp. IMI 355080]|nr:hypothetical protein N0V82_007630 [Gnomoniopsis sp. IMI 355080]